MSNDSLAVLVASIEALRSAWKAESDRHDMLEVELRTSAALLTIRLRHISGRYPTVTVANGELAVNFLALGKTEWDDGSISAFLADCVKRAANELDRLHAISAATSQDIAIVIAAGDSVGIDVRKEGEGGKS